MLILFCEKVYGIFLEKFITLREIYQFTHSFCTDCYPQQNNNER